MAAENRPAIEADAGEVPAPAQRGFTRRRMLAGTAGASLAAVLAGKADAIERLLGALVSRTTPLITTATYTFSVERETDMALLDVSFYGFNRKEAAGGVVTLVPASTANVIVVQLPPQHIGEAAYPWQESELGHWAVDPPPVLSAVAGPSRLCFMLLPEQSVKFSAPMQNKDLLDWSTWTLLVPASAKTTHFPSSPLAQRASRASRPRARRPLQRKGAAARRPASRRSRAPSRAAATVRARAAAGAGAAQPGEPGEKLTSIEYPYGLYLAPTVSTALAKEEGFTTTFVGRGEPVIGSHTMPTGEVSDLWTVSLQQATRPAIKGVGSRPSTAGSRTGNAGGPGVIEPLTPQMVAVGLRPGHATGEPGKKKFRIKYKPAVALLAWKRGRRRGEGQP